MSVEQRISLGTAVNDHLARRYGDRLKSETLKQLQNILGAVERRLRDDNDPFNLFGGRN